MDANFYANKKAKGQHRPRKPQNLNQGDGQLSEYTEAG